MGRDQSPPPSDFQQKHAESAHDAKKPTPESGLLAESDLNRRARRLSAPFLADGSVNRLLVELSEADSKKWLSLLGHRTSALLVDEQSTLPADNVHLTRRPTRQRQTRLSGEQVQDLVSGYVSGSTVYELAAQFGCHRKTISNLLKKCGVTLRMASMTEEQIAEAIALYESGLSLAKVGARLGFNDNTVRLRLIECGVQMRDFHGRDRTAD